MKRNIAFVLGGLVMASCAGTRRETAPVRDWGAVPARIVVDGDVSDWPADSALLADEHYLYFRFMVQGEQFTLQQSARTVALMIDVDADASTGQRRTEPGLENLGVDLEIDFSPAPDRKGCAAFAIDSAGHRTPVANADLELTFAPTYAAGWYEGRITRLLPACLPRAGLATKGEVAAAAATLGADGKADAYADPSVTVAPPAAASPPRATVVPPRKPEGGLRVVTYNIEKSSPVERPDTFRHILTVLEPDIVLLQEWEEGDEESVRRWFAALVGGAGEWRVCKAAGTMATGGGVAIATRLPVEGEAMRSFSFLHTAETGATGRAKDTRAPVRFIAERVRTPLGDVLVGSTHLKSRGGKDSPEDKRRAAEARAVNATLGAAQDRPALCIIGGDMNLVGSRPPLDLLRAGLDGGNDLAVAEPRTLGDWTVATWRDDKEPFTPGRLDYVLYSASSLRVARAFVLDTRRLSAAALARVGLAEGDSAGSDHMPVVVDFVRAER